MPPKKGPRKSLSDWYRASSDGDGSGSAQHTPPRDGSPAKRCRTRPGPPPGEHHKGGDGRRRSRYFIGGDDSESISTEGRTNPSTPEKALVPSEGAALEIRMTPPASPSRPAAPPGLEATLREVRGLCAAYIQEQVAPTLRRLEQAQEQLGAQLAELRGAVARKADVEEVPCAAWIEELVAKEAERGVLAELRAVAGALEEGPEKAPADGPPASDEARAVAATLQRTLGASGKADVPELAGLRADVKKMQLLVAAAGARFDKLDKQLVAERGEPSAGERTDARKMQIIVAAAGARFDKQLRELRQQLRELRQQIGQDAPAGAAALGERWPGRVLPEPGPMSDAGSDTGSAVGSVACTSIAGSAAGSALGAEEQAEIKRIQAIVGAAGTAFSREMRDMRAQVTEVRKELRGVQDTLAGRSAAAAA